MHCSNNNPISKSNFSIYQAPVHDAKNTTQNLHNAISAAIQEQIQFLKDSPAKFAINLPSRIYCHMLLSKWEQFDNMFNEQNDDDIRSLQKEMHALATTKIVTFEKKISILTPCGEIPIEVIQHRRYKLDLLHCFSIHTQNNYPICSFSKADFIKLWRALFNYSDYLRVIKKDDSLPFYQTSSDDEINKYNSNLIFDPDLLNNIPTEQRTLILSYLKPCFYMPSNTIICVIHEQSLFQLIRMPFLNKEKDTLEIHEYYKELPSVFFQAYKKISQEAGDNFTLFFKQKSIANRLNSLLAKYLKTKEKIYEAQN